MLISKIHWSRRLRRRSTFYFVDNEAAKNTLITAYSSHPIVSKLLSAAAGLDVTDSSLSWFERVPSPSNVADAPSRGEPPLRLPGLPPPSEEQVDDITSKVLEQLVSTST